MNVMVYQAYGREDVLRQTMFSIVSLLSEVKDHSTIQIWVYTDNRKIFADYFGALVGDRAIIRIFEVQREQIQKWRGAIDFVHRVKVEVLQDAADKFNGPLFYVDGDTFFIGDPTRLFAQVNDDTSLMHVAENALSAGRDPLSKKIAKFVKKNSFSVAGEAVQLSPETVMWNAGALGISQKNKKFLPSVLELTDQMYSLYPKHVMEQLAFSYILQRSTRLVSGEKAIGHYWNQKPEYQIRIDEFLSRNPNWESARNSYARFEHPAAPAPVVKKSFWPSWLRF